MAKQYLPIDEGDYELRLQQHGEQIALHETRLDAIDGSAPSSGSSIPYKIELDTIDRPDIDRWNDHLNIAEVAPIDPTGGASTFHTAMNLAWAKAIARNRRSVIEIPAGNFRLGAEIELLNDFSLNAHHIGFRGLGKTQTAIIGPAVAHDVVRIGKYTDPGPGTQSGNITFSDLMFSPGAVHTGALLGLRNVRDVYLFRVRLNGGLDGMSLDRDPLNAPKRCNYIWLVDCEGSCQPNGRIFRVKATEVLVVRGGKWGGGTSRKFLEHDDLIYNCDGVYIQGGYFEQFEYYIDSIGNGMGNVQIHAAQFDRAGGAFLRAQPPAGSNAVNKNWVVHDTQFLSGEFTQDAIIWDASTGHAINAKCTGLLMGNCTFHRVKGRILVCPKGDGVMHGITARTCGYEGTELIRMGAEGNFELGLIQGKREDSAYGLPTYGIVYDGPSTGKRGHTGCRFWDATLGQTLGTP